LEETQTVKYGKVATAPETNPTKEGFVFAGWNFDFATAITGEVEVKAKWQEIVEVATYADFYTTVTTKPDAYVKVTAHINATANKNEQLWANGATTLTDFSGTIDGQGYTISNLNVDSSAQTGEHYSSGLFGWCESGATIKNVNIDGATVIGNHNVAVIVGYTYSIKISNCHVTNANIVCKHANGDACGDKCGIISGYVGNEARISNCSATDCTVKAGRDGGQLIGCGYNVSVKDCFAKNVTVTANGDCTGKDIRNELIGRVMG
jgi:hypothetical protein